MVARGGRLARYKQGTNCSGCTVRPRYRRRRRSSAGPSSSSAAARTTCTARRTRSRPRRRGTAPSAAAGHRWRPRPSPLTTARRARRLRRCSAAPATRSFSLRTPLASTGTTIISARAPCTWPLGVLLATRCRPLPINTSYKEPLLAAVLVLYARTALDRTILYLYSPYSR